MADLSIGSSAGTQSSTQSPQGLVSSGSNTAPATSVQPGGMNLQSETATTPTGIALHPTPLQTVNVDTSAKPATTTTATVATVQSKHHVNGLLLGVSAGLFVIAVVIFWIITRSAKNTTNYK